MIQRATALFWAIAACAFLWLFSLADLREFSQKPTAPELFDSFLLTSLMILGGSGCYHFLTSILSANYTESNSATWFRLMLVMAGFMAIILSIPVFIVFFRDNIEVQYGILLSYGYLILGAAIASWLSFKIEALFNTINSNN